MLAKSTLTYKRLIEVSIYPSAEPNMRKVIALVIAFMSVLAGCSRPWQTSRVEPVPPSLDASYASPRADAYGSPPWEDAPSRARSTE